MFKIMTPDEIRKQQIENSKWKKEAINIPKDPRQRDWLNDDEYNKTMRLHEPIYKWLINAYKFDPNLPGDNLKYPILTLGFHTYPLANELSMWSYPTSIIVDNEEQKKKVIKNQSVHAGTANILTYDYLIGIPRTRVVVFIDDEGTIPRKKLPEYFSYLKKRCSILIVAFRDWKDTDVILKSIGGNQTRIGLDQNEYIIVISY